MKILFSPSESKNEASNSHKIDSSSFIFPKLFDKRLEIVKSYLDYVKNASIKELQELFGIKDEQECLKLQSNELLHVQTQKAVLRYSGVAYEYLGYASLNPKQKEFIDNNVIIFSNLFGPLLAKNSIPLYKLKQGSSFNALKIEQFYKENFSNAIDDFIGDELVIDLRAGFYEKFYTLNRPYITMKFIKNGKVVSHWAKAYRGIILKDLSRFQPQSIEEFEKVPFQNLKIEEIQVKKHKREYIFSILDD